MGAGHDHGTAAIRQEKPLWSAIGLTSTFFVAQVVGGLLTNSLALLADAAHMATDVIALAISLVAVGLIRTYRHPTVACKGPHRTWRDAKKAGTPISIGDPGLSRTCLEL